MNTTSTSSFRKSPELAYYREVDVSKTQPLNNMNISDLRRLASSPQELPQSTEQAPSTAYIHYSLFLKTGQLDDLNQAILQANNELPTDNNPDYAPRLRDLVTMLAVKFQHTNSLDNLQDAIFRAQEMVASTPQEHPDRPVRVGDWIRLMLMKFDHTGLQDDLDEARFSAQEVGAAIEVEGEDGRGMKVRVVIPA